MKKGNIVDETMKLINENYFNKKQEDYIDPEPIYEVLIYETEGDYDMGEPFQYNVFSNLDEAKNILKELIKFNGYFSGYILNQKTGDEEFSLSYSDLYKTEDLEKSEEDDLKNPTIVKTGNARCEYTGGDIYVAFIPVKVNGEDCVITLDSESEQLDEVDGGEFAICDKDDFNLIPKYGDKGLMVFDNDSPYMSLYNSLKKSLQNGMD